MQFAEINGMNILFGCPNNTNSSLCMNQCLFEWKSNNCLSGIESMTVKFVYKTMYGGISADMFIGTRLCAYVICM